MAILIILLLLLIVISAVSFVVVLTTLYGKKSKWLWDHIGQPILNYFFVTTVRRVTMAYFSAVVNINAFLPLCSLVVNIKTKTWEANAGLMVYNPFPDWSAVFVSILLTIGYLAFLGYERWNPTMKHNREKARKKELIQINTTQLSSCPYQFKGEMHLERQEVSEIIKWIQTPGVKKDEDRICMLTGTAGLGKTVVLHDLLQELENVTGYQAYGIKADQIDFSKEEIEDFITLYTDEFEAKTEGGVKPVLIIDQIDALSKTLSADRNPITLLDSLINSVVRIKDVRIIVSCRPYDLDFDPLLKKYEYRKNIALRPLEYQQVVEVLKHFKRNVPSEKTKLATFLGVPNNMQWFLEYGKDDCEVVSLQSLMDEMWTQRITDVKSKNKRLSANSLSECLHRITQVMNDSSSLVCSKKRLEKDFSKEISYLISEHVLIQSTDRKHVMFPHQSLADYVSARLAYENGQTMADMLENEHQGLYVRNRVKQYFAYIREADSEAYLKELKHIVVDDTAGTYRTHIKLLLLSTLAGFDEPSDEEKLVRVDGNHRLEPFSSNIEWWHQLVNDREAIKDETDEAKIKGWLDHQAKIVRSSISQKIVPFTIVMSNAKDANNFEAKIFHDINFKALPLREEASLKIISDLHEQGKTVITISHDMEFVANNFDRVIVMANKHIVREGTPHEIFWDEDSMEKAKLKPPYVSRICRELGIQRDIITIDEAAEEILQLRK